jgi:zinc/manganese transport system permease protein
MTAILGYLGLHVLRREIVFVDIALAQVVAVGAIGAHLVFRVEPNSPVAYLSAFGLAIVAAAFYAFTRRRVLQISTEAVIGVSYAIAAAVALFLLGVAPGGDVHAQHMLAGSILWATWTDLAVCCVVFAAVGGCFYLLRRPFERISSDYDGALREGMKVVAWDFLFYSLIGVVITFAVRIGGVVVVFCLLIIPATIAVMSSTSLRTRLLVAWAAGICGSLLGLLFADRLDFSVGPSVALLLGVGLALVAIRHRLPAVPAAGIAVATAVVYVALLLVVPAPAESALEPPGAPAGIDATSPAEPATEEATGIDVTSPDAPLETAADPQSRCDRVLQVLDSDFSAGVPLAVEFLAEDPPLFFRQSVIDRLNAGRAEPLPFDATQPFADPVNQAALEQLRQAD